jgi:hypothetical protein
MPNDAAFAALGAIIAIAAMARHDGNNNRFIIGTSSSVGLDTTCLGRRCILFFCAADLCASVTTDQSKALTYKLPAYPLTINFLRWNNLRRPVCGSHSLAPLGIEATDFDLVSPNLNRSAVNNLFCSFKAAALFGNSWIVGGDATWPFSSKK